MAESERMAKKRRRTEKTDEQATSTDPLLTSSPSSSPTVQPQSYSFGDASAGYRLRVKCQDVSLTHDGRSLLLAASKHGLIEMCVTSRRELSHWLPPWPSSHYEPDEVCAVAALSDRRAVVSLCYAQRIVLLRRNTKGIKAWTKIRGLIDQPDFSPCLLSAHGDVLAASYSASNADELELLSLSSGRRLSATTREYEIECLAVTAIVVVTGSSDPVELGRGHRAAVVIDAYSLDTDGGCDVRLWRHTLASNSKRHEELRGICPDSSGGCLYVGVCWSKGWDARVSALSLADGSVLRRVALCVMSPSIAARLPRRLLPSGLTLCVDRTAAEGQNRSDRALLLAVLCWDSLSEKIKSVTIHHSICDTLQ